MKAWAEFYPDALPELPGVPLVMFDHWLRQIAIEFCERSRAYVVELAAINAVAEQMSYLRRGVGDEGRAAVRRVAVLLLLWCAAVLAGAVAMLWALVGALVDHPRTWRVIVAMDQALNAAGGGSEDETISSRAARARRNGRRWGCFLCRLLDALDKDHCNRAYESERRQEPPGTP